MSTPARRRARRRKRHRLAREKVRDRRLLRRVEWQLTHAGVAVSPGVFSKELFDEFRKLDQQRLQPQKMWMNQKDWEDILKWAEEEEK